MGPNRYLTRNRAKNVIQPLAGLSASENRDCLVLLTGSLISSTHFRSA
jgi:hypothetical protein